MPYNAVWAISLTTLYHHVDPKYSVISRFLCNCKLSSCAKGLKEGFVLLYWSLVSLGIKYYTAANLIYMLHIQPKLCSYLIIIVVVTQNDVINKINIGQKWGVIWKGFPQQYFWARMGLHKVIFSHFSCMDIGNMAWSFHEAVTGRESFDNASMPIFADRYYTAPSM